MNSPCLRPFLSKKMISCLWGFRWDEAIKLPDGLQRYKEIKRKNEKRVETYSFSRLLMNLSLSDLIAVSECPSLARHTVWKYHFNLFIINCRPVSSIG